MKVGDLVVFDPMSKNPNGSLTAVKYFIRIHEKIGGEAGLIVGISGTNCSVSFPGKEIIVLNKHHLRCISESR